MTATSIPTAVIYLLLFFAEVLGQPAGFRADYFQDGVPLYRVTTEIETGTTDTFRIWAMAHDASGEGMDEDREPMFVARIEQSDLVSHNYLLYLPDRAVPSVVTLGPLYGELVSVAEGALRSFELDSAPVASEDLEIDLGSTIFLLARRESLVLSAPDAGILLISAED